MTSTEFNETTTLRTAWESIKTRLSRGEDVTPDELVNAERLANAEEQIETGRRTRHERKRAEQDQAEAREQALDLVAEMEPDARQAGLDRVEQAWQTYLDVCATEQDRAGQHSKVVRKLIALVARGWPGDDQDNRTLPGIAVVAGKRYGLYDMPGSELPHTGRNRADYRERQIRQRK